MGNELVVLFKPTFYRRYLVAFIDGCTMGGLLSVTFSDIMWLKWEMK